MVIKIASSTNRGERVSEPDGIVSGAPSPSDNNGIMTTLSELLPDLERLITLDPAAVRTEWADALRSHLCVDLNGISDLAWLQVREHAREALIADNRPFVEQLPTLLQLEDCALALPAMSTRLRNLLLREGLTTWDRFAALSPAEILDRRNAGQGTLDEVLGYVLDVARRQGPLAEGGALPASPSIASAQLVMPLVAGASRLDLQLIATWSIRAFGASVVSDVVNPKAPLQAIQTMPVEVREAWERLAAVPLTDYAQPDLLRITVDELLERLSDCLNDAERHVIAVRLLAPECAPTLEEVGRELGLTRERVRQIQAKARSKLEAQLVSPALAPLAWAVQRLASSLGGLASLQEPSTLASLARELGRDVLLEDDAARWLLMLAGPYELRGDWLVRSGVTAPAPLLIAEHADEQGVIDLASLEEHLARLPMSDRNIARWIGEAGLAKRVADRLVLWQGSIVDKIAVVLSARGEPADVETLVEMVGEGHSIKGTRNRLFEDDRFVRVGKTLWALRAWGLEEYTGIADELRQRIEERGGAALLSDVVTEIVETFGVRESSVRLYATAPMFVIDAGVIRLRGAEEPYPVDTDIRGVRGCYGEEGLLHFIINVDKDVLRGSGQQCPVAVAGRLGVSPGHPREFQHEAGRLAVTWVESAGLGPSLGSTRALAELTSADAGDQLLLTFDVNGATVRARKILRSAGSALELATELCGLPLSELDPRAALARAIGVPASDVGAVLTRRGDRELAALLPAPAEDSELDAALEDLEALLSELEA
jgi:hypothetical protein